MAGHWKMTKWFYSVSFGFYGAYSTGIIEAETEDQAMEEARELAIENAESFGFNQDPEFFGDYDQVGRKFDDESGSYDEEGTLDYYVEPYEPEKHDDLI